MGSLLVKNAALVATMDDQRREIPDCDILIQDSAIVQVGPGIQTEADQVFDAGGCLVLPGFTNTHNHTFQALYRVIPQTLQVGFVEWITFMTNLWLKRPFSPEAIHAAALANFGEMLLSGCTISADQHYLYPAADSPGYVDSAVDAARTIGIRFHPSRGCLTMGRSKGGLVPNEFVQTEDEVLRDADNLIRKYHDPGPFSMTRMVLAPLGIYSDSETIYREMKRLAEAYPKVHCHTHLHEISDAEISQALYGVRPLDFMERVGWVGPEVLFYHFVSPAPTEDEIRRVAASGQWVSHCIASDLRLGYGLTPMRELLDAGANVCLGTTGPASNCGADMVTEMRLVALAHRLRFPEPERWLSAREILYLGTRAGAQALGRDDLGSIEPGKGADLAIFDMDRLDLAGHHDPMAALVFMGSCQYTKATIVDGRIVAEQGRLTTVDHERVNHEARAWASRLAD